MDPVTGFQAAAAIIGLIDIAARTGHKAVQIYKSDVPPEIQDWNLIATDAQMLVERLGRSSGMRPLSEDDQGLLDLSCRARLVANDVINETAELLGTGRKSRWQALRVSGKMMWRQRTINELLIRLSHVRGELSMRLLTDLRSIFQEERIGNDHRLKNLETKIDQLAKRFAENRMDLLDHISRQMKKDSESQGKERFEKLLHAIQSMPSISSATSKLESHISEADLLSAERATQEALLSCLNYRGREDRKQMLPIAHRTTSGWAESEETSPQIKWNNLITWIQQGGCIYWINGKAASGKSTLVKFLLNSSAIWKASKAWAGRNTLLLDGFYFWHLGTDIQKSQEGLLRTLLHSLLTCCPSFCKDAFPAFYKQYMELHIARLRALNRRLEQAIDPPKNLHNGSDTSHDLVFLDSMLHNIEPLSLNEIQAAIPRVFHHLPDTLRVMFFIDGLDEYSGDPTVICDLLKSIASDKVRFVISSRPTTYCIAAFSQYQGLRLQDLTGHDITKYVDDVLTSHKRMSLFRSKEPQTTHELISRVVDKASGVFLWVYLVVKALVVALDKGDRLQDLIIHVDSLPEELTDLYRHMMAQMEPSYRREGSQYIQLVVEASSVQRNYWALTLQQLFYAEEYKATDLFHPTANSLDRRLLNMELEALEARLISRCCGLLEIVKFVFLHKTVVDFLQETENWKYILELGNSQPADLDGFCLSYSLAISVVKIIQVYPVKSEPPPDWIESQFFDASSKEKVWFRIRYMIAYLRDYLFRCKFDDIHRQILDTKAKSLVKSYLEAGGMEDRDNLDTLQWGGTYLLAGWRRRSFSVIPERHTAW